MAQWQKTSICEAWVPSLAPPKQEKQRTNLKLKSGGVVKISYEFLFPTLLILILNTFDYVRLSKLQLISSISIIF